MSSFLNPKSLRPFIGSADFDISRSFYKDLHFEENQISDKLSLFIMGKLCFYLQDYYLKDWIENSMILMEVDNVMSWWNFLEGLELDKKYSGIRLIPVKEEDWGKECLLIDPAGILWHFAEFNK